MHPDNQISVAIGISLIAALILRLIAWPPPLAFVNPDWILLVLIYWCMALPERFGVGLAWLTGLFVDAATGRLLGQQALVYALTAYGCVRFHPRLRVFPLTQQLPLVLLFLLISQLGGFCIEVLRGKPQLSWTYWLPSLAGTLAWPAVLAFCRSLKQRWQTSP